FAHATSSFPPRAFGIDSRMRLTGQRSLQPPRRTTQWALTPPAWWEAVPSANPATYALPEESTAMLLPPVWITAAEVGGVDERASGGIELGHKGVTIAAAARQESHTGVGLAPVGLKTERQLAVARGQSRRASWSGRGDFGRGRV